MNFMLIQSYLLRLFRLSLPTFLFSGAQVNEFQKLFILYRKENKRRNLL